MPPHFPTKLSQLSGHTGPVYCLSAGRQPHTVFSGGTDGFVAEWNLHDMTAEKFSVKLGNPVFSLCPIPGTTLLAVGLFNGHLHIIDWQLRQEVKHFAMETKGVFSLAFDETTGLLYSGGGDGVMNVWDITSWELTLSLPLAQGKIRHIYPLGKEVYICAGDGMIRVLENGFFNELFSVDAHPGGVYRVLHLQGLLYSAGKDAHIKVWDPKTMLLLESIPAHNYAIYGLAEWPAGGLASASRDKTIKLWDPRDFSRPLRLDFKSVNAHQRSVNALHVCEWNNSLISCSDDGRLMVWKTND